MTSTQIIDPQLASALAAGLITSREATEGAVEMAGTALLLHGRPIAYARPAVAVSSAAVEREVRCLGLLADTGLVPELLHSGEDEVWTAAVRGTRVGELSGTMADLAETCQAWGAALATLHRTRIVVGTEPPVAPRPWVLDPDRLPLGMRHAPTGSARAFVLRTLRADRGLRRTVDRVADRWNADHWTHGDLTADRVLVQHSPDLRVRFVDLRSGGLGDPAWDLAGAVETIAELTTGPRARWGAASGACLSDYLLQGYRRVGGSIGVDPGTRALRMLARCWDEAVALDARAPHAMHPAAGVPFEAIRLVERLGLARELAGRSARPGLLAA